MDFASVVMALASVLLASCAGGQAPYPSEPEAEPMAAPAPPSIDYTFPLFPYPGVPIPSSFYAIELSNADPRVKSYFSAATLIERSFQNAGYSGFHYFSLPIKNESGEILEGLIMITDPERIDDGGTRASFSAFNLDFLDSMTSLSILEYLKHLFTAPSGRYRFLILAITEGNPPLTNVELTHASVQELEDKGAPFPGSTFHRNPITKDSLLSFFIYEFKTTTGGDPQQLGNGRLAPLTHLRASGVADQLDPWSLAN